MILQEMSRGSAVCPMWCSCLALSRGHRSAAPIRGLMMFGLGAIPRVRGLTLGYILPPLPRNCSDPVGTVTISNTDDLSKGPHTNVSIVGSVSGQIRGSLVVDQNSTRIFFIETGQSGVLGSAAPCTLFGVLPNDTYTVTLRLLTIANVPGAVDTTSTPGVAIVTFSSSGLILGPSGGAIFANLTVSVPSTAGYGEKEILDLQNIQINGGAISALDDAAIHVSGFLGDATGDGIYTGEDALRIARVAVGIDPGFLQWVLADPLIVGDVSGDQVLTGLDALIVARQAVGITQSVIPEIPPGVTTGIAGADPVVSIGTAVSAKPQAANAKPQAANAKSQATVVVPVNLDPGAYAPRLAGLDSVNLAIAYDTSRVDVVSAVDVVRGSLTQTFDNFTVNVDRAAGIIYISCYHGLVSGGVVSGEW